MKITRNIAKSVGLVNGTQGTIEGFFYDTIPDQDDALNYDKIKYVIVSVDSLKDGQ